MHNGLEDGLDNDMGEGLPKDDDMCAIEGLLGLHEGSTVRPVRASVRQLRKKEVYAQNTLIQLRNNVGASPPSMKLSPADCSDEGDEAEEEEAEEVPTVCRLPGEGQNNDSPANDLRGWCLVQHRMPRAAPGRRIYNSYVASASSSPTSSGQPHPAVVAAPPPPSTPSSPQPPLPRGIPVWHGVPLSVNVLSQVSCAHLHALTFMRSPSCSHLNALTRGKCAVLSPAQLGSCQEAGHVYQPPEAHMPSPWHSSLAVPQAGIHTEHTRWHL
jgi:hypothetical protein